MRGDFSRSTWRAVNHYSSVRLQQGRVLLDAEWNEQVDIAEHAHRTTTTDVVGRHGAPKHPLFANFAVALTDDATDLRIAPGRIYVEGTLCENDATVHYSAQPDLPGASAPAAGNYAVYLDVWERHITAVDQHGDAFPSLLEPALRGPDTATRTRVVWQVRLQQIDTPVCGQFVAPAASTGRLRAIELPAAVPTDDCLVPPGGGYRRLENQLYRVEVHAVADTGPLLKWSRDNASMVSRTTAVDAAALTIAVEDEGRDDVLGFASARWVELTDEERAVRGEAGALLAVDHVAGAAVTVVNPDGLSLATGTNPTLRRWDGVVPAVAATPVELEDGVQIEVDSGTFAVGDHWMVAARTVTGKVETRRDTAVPPAALFEPPNGVHHAYCPLAVVAFDGQVYSQLGDCRPLFPPLTAITAGDVSYDPANCGNLGDATTVQAAIDILCRGVGGEREEPGIHLERIDLLEGDELRNEMVVDPRRLASGIAITCDQQLFHDSVRNEHGMPNPVCTVTLDLPWPSTGVEREQWRIPSFGIVGFTTMTLSAEVEVDNNQIFWLPTEKQPSFTKPWLAEGFTAGLQTSTHGQVQRVLARLRLRGNFIWGPEAPELYLDGEAFGVPGDGVVDVRLPSGNGRRGGDFEMWFWVGREG
jgi:hypothetical protein